MKMAVGFKHATLMILVIIVDIIAREPVIVEGVSLSSGGSDTSGHPTSTDVDDDQPTPSDLEQIEMLRDRIAKLQSDITDIVQSFSALDIVSKHPSMMTNVDVETRDGDLDHDSGRSRSRRDLDAPLSLPTEAPSSSNVPGAGSGVRIPNYPGYLGPYGGPMYSGQCFLCPAGTPGPRGAPGPAGLAGRDGRDGRDASPSPLAQYVVDVPHDSGPSSVRGNPGNEQSSTAPRQPEVTSRNISHGGAVYTRWGKSECADGAELIYTGTIGGAHYTHTGSGSNYLCLPNEPIYDEVDPINAERGLLYSSEYQTSAAPGRTHSVHDLTPVCAVCKAPATHTSVLMVPARNVCPSDAWRLEYAGYLMSEKYTHKRSEFICVDRAFEAESGTQGDQNGVLLYMVEARCIVGGGLPCQPYIDGYELTCAVCTM